jgi:hypothetical protein
VAKAIVGHDDNSVDIAEMGREGADGGREEAGAGLDESGRE